MVSGEQCTVDCCLLLCRWSRALRLCELLCCDILCWWKWNYVCPLGGAGHPPGEFDRSFLVLLFRPILVERLGRCEPSENNRSHLVYTRFWSVSLPHSSVCISRLLASLTPLVPQFAALIQQSIYAPLKISVHYTRASENPPGKDFLPPGLTLSAGRPKLGKILDAVISRAVSYGSGVKASMDITGVVVGVCGPAGLGDEVAQVISQVDAGRRWAVGGIEVHEE